ncbi:hypothetical protein HYV85_05040 [Candidatus Woesearchaeota archaeon]|nr:hypothetical protein [Candidatus Woesearchaeota archaeon]
MSEDLILKERSREEIKAIVLARLETLNKDAKIMLMGFDKPLTVKDLIKEVEKDTTLGKKVVEVQFAFLKMLANGEI